MAPTTNIRNFYLPEKSQNSETRRNSATSKLMDVIWPLIREVDNIDQLRTVVSKAGFSPLILKKTDLFRAKSHPKNKHDIESDFGTLIGKLVSFGCLADGKTDDSTGNPQLIQRELELVQLGVPKSTINQLVVSMERGRNSGKPACVIIDFCPIKTDENQAAALATAFLLHQEKNLFFDYHPTVVLGSDEGDVMTKVDKDLIDHGEQQGLDAVKALHGENNEPETYLKEVDNGQHMLDKCSFSNLAILTFESIDYNFSRCK